MAALNGWSHRMNDNFHLSEDDKMTVLVSCEAPGVIQALEKRGVRVLTVDICEQLDVPVRSHADMQVLPLDDCVLISPYQTRLKTQLEQMNLRVIVGEELEKKYPKDVLYNVCLVGNHYICNYKTISRQAQQLLDARGYHPIFVAQGYANCSVAVVDEHSIITADCGIARACRAAGLDVLQICPGFIRIPVYDTGFIGGCCGKLGADQLAFTGRLDSHPDGMKIREFVKERGVQIIELTDEPLFDIGGLLQLKTKNSLCS